MQRHAQTRTYITYHNPVRGEPNHDQQQCAEKMVKISLVVFEIIRADRQTDRQIDILISILHTPTLGEVSSSYTQKQRQTLNVNPEYSRLETLSVGGCTHVGTFIDMSTDIPY